MTFKKGARFVHAVDHPSATTTELESIVSELLDLDTRSKADKKRIDLLKTTLKKDYPDQPWVVPSRGEGFRASTHEREHGFNYDEFAVNHPALFDRLVITNTVHELDIEECNRLSETFPELTGILQKYVLPGTMVTTTRRFKVEEEDD